MRKGAFRDETGTYLEELAEALRAAGLADEKTATPLARWMEQRSPGGLPLDNLQALRAAYAEELEGILPKAWEEAWEEAATRLPPGTSPSPGVVAVLLSLSDRLPPGALLQTHEVEGKTLCTAALNLDHLTGQFSQGSHPLSTGSPKRPRASCNPRPSEDAYGCTPGRQTAPPRPAPPPGSCTPARPPTPL